MYKKVNVVMLPTNEKAQVTFVKHTQGKNVGKLQMPVAGGEYRRLLSYDFEPQHLYFLSDEKIEDSDWIYCKLDDKPIQYFKDKAAVDSDLREYGYKKIIATTDKSLKIRKPQPNSLDLFSTLLETLPQPSQQFIEKYIEEYNKGNIITEVMVEYEKKIEVFGGLFATGKERVELKINPKDNTITIRKVKDSWNKEEVETIYRQGRNDAYQETKSGFDLIDIVNASDKWIKENL